MKSSARSLVCVLAFILLSCKSSTEPDVVPASRIRVNGKIASALRKTSGTPATISKVLVYRDFGIADLVSVTAEGTFNVDVDRKTCGLIFLDGNSPVGYLLLPSGVAALPLMMVDSTVAQIDLKDITIQNGIATPGHDPIGSEVQMNADELAAYKLQSSLFAAIIQNLDMNGDGTLDVLSSRPYWLRFGADFNGGTAPTADPGANAATPILWAFHFNFANFASGQNGSNSQLTAPDGHQFNIHEWADRSWNESGVSRNMTVFHWVLQNTSWGSFVPGTYKILCGGETVSFTAITPLNADDYIVASNLWYEKTGTKITKVHWQWRMLNGAPINATRLIQKENIILQFNFGVGTGVQKNYRVSASATSCDVDVDTNGLTQILLSVYDLFGNWMPTFYAI